MSEQQTKIRAYEPQKESQRESEENKSLTISNAESALMANREMSMGVWHMINTIADDVYRSRLFPVSSPQQAAAIMLKGYEIGLGLMASFEFVQVVKGNVGLSPKGALAMLHNSPKIEDLELTRLTDEHNKFIGYQCRMKRADNGFEHTERWVLEDAVTAQLMKPDSNWEKYPENMCKWRAIGFCADVVAPDVTAGMVDFMIRPEQFGVRIDDEGNIIEGKTTVVESEAKPKNNGGSSAVKPDQPEITITLTDLLDQYSAEQIMVANGGTIPGTSEELERVANALIKEAQEGGN
jgi:hypothetical protein